MTEKRKKTLELLCAARAARLDGLVFVQDLDIDTIEDGYNGIGPEFLDPDVRGKVTKYLALFEPAALVHDLRNEFSDGTREGFARANDEFLANCRKLADHRYCALDPRRYRARAVARLLYRFVNAERFGWRAWLEAKKRHEEKTKPLA